MSTIKELVAVEIAKHLAPAISESAQRHLTTDRIDSIVGPLVKELLGEIEPTPTPKTTKTTRVKEATSKAKAKTTGTSYIEVSPQTADTVGLDRDRISQAKDEAKKAISLWIKSQKKQGTWNDQDKTDYTGMINCTTNLGERVLRGTAARYPNQKALSQYEAALDTVAAIFRKHHVKGATDRAQALYDAYGKALEQCAKAHEARTEQAKAQLALYESESVIA